MRPFLRFVLDNPAASFFLAVFLGIAGIYAAVHLPVDLFPPLEIPVVNITSHLPGAGPEEVERLVSRPIEDQVRAVAGVKRVASSSIQGISTVTVEFGRGTTVGEARQLVLARLARVAGDLPAGVVPRLESVGLTLQEVCAYVFFGGGDPVDLRRTVRYDVAGSLMGVEGVSLVQVLGGDRRAFLVELDPLRLSSLGITVSQVAAALRGHNLSSLGGWFGRSGKDYLVRGNGRLGNLRDLESVPVGRRGKRPILLGEIARVREGRVPRHYVVRGNGLPAVALIVSKQPGANTVKVVRGVDEALARLRRLLPPGTKVKKFYDQSEIIQEAQGTILEDLVAGAVLAFLVLFFFLGAFRPTFIVTLTVPVAFLAALAAMKWMGLGLNMITLTALALSVGMIVDDSIVVAENIQRRASGGLPPGEAALEGTLEIAAPDASGTFTTIAAFLPLLTAGGVFALFTRPFGWTLGAALAASLLLSLTLVPTLFSGIKGEIRREASFPGRRLLSFLDRVLGRILSFSFRRKFTVLFLAFLFLGFAGVSAFLGRVSLLPPVDEGAVLLEYIMPPGTSLEESDRMGRILDKMVLSHPAVDCVYRRTGSPGVGRQVEGVNKGELLIKLKSRKERKVSAARVLADLKRSCSRLEGVVFLYHQPTQEKIDESFSGLPALFGVTLFGPNPDVLVRLAGRVEKILAKDPAISNIVNNTKIRVPEVDVRPDYPALAARGVDPGSLFDTLRAAGPGLEATRVVREKEDVAILVRLKGRDLLDPARIEDLPLPRAGGGWVPLGRVARVRIRHTPSSVTRLNGRREVTLEAEVEGNIPAVVKRLRQAFRSLSLPPGYNIEFTGRYKVLLEAALEGALALLGALALIFLIMAAQFRSLLQPLVILATVPLSLVGALVGLALSGLGLDVSAGMGAVTLVGIAVNNAIVLVDQANRAGRAGAAWEAALLSAASVRLRPILLTSLTTMAALLPAVFWTGPGSHIFQPFAVTLVGGLLSGTLATLVVVPTLLAAAAGRG